MPRRFPPVMPCLNTVLSLFGEHKSGTTWLATIVLALAEAGCGDPTRLEPLMFAAGAVPLGRTDGR